MKRTVLTLLLLSAVYHSQAFSVSIEKFKTSDNFIINVDNPVGSKIILAIKDKNGQPIWQESHLYVEKMRRVIFLGSLTPGEYLLEVANEQEAKSTPIQIQGKDKTVHPENGKTLVVGFSKPRPDYSFDIIVQNKLDKNASLKVFKNKALLLEQDLGKEEIIKKVFKLPDAEKGDFVVRVGTGDNMYQYRFTK